MECFFCHSNFFFVYLQKIKALIQFMTKEEVLKQLRWTRDEVYDPNCTDNSALKLLYKAQKDAYDRCIKLIEQIET